MASIRRMPLGYGPTPGPRQQASGEPRHLTATETLAISVTAEVVPETVKSILPAPFELTQPYMILEAQRLRNIDWLAGRGYNIVSVKIPASCRTIDGIIEGDYASVLWENRAEPIITGREELGFAKIFGDIEIATNEPLANIEVAASWEGYQFFGMSVSDLTENSSDVIGPGRVRFHHKYIPATGTWGGTDVSYPVMSPSHDPYKVVSRVWTGIGGFDFKRGGFQQLPTMDYIVNRLADINILRFSTARVVLSHGGKSLRDQTLIRTVHS